MNASKQLLLTLVLALGAGMTGSQVLLAEEPVVLEIDTRNAVLYRGNVFDTAKLGMDPDATTSSNLVFLNSVAAGDIIAVNGKPAKGLWQYHVLAMPFRTNPGPRQPIADLDSSGVFHCHFHFLQPDGTYIGELSDSGVNPRSGWPHAIHGALGAFFGATGQVRMIMETPIRGASVSEDPAHRRNHGGANVRHTVFLYPKHRPEVEMTPIGPAIFHADFSPVSAARPARAGETLILRARGLGPVWPDVDPPGLRAFSSDPAQEVNSSVEVIVNGTDAVVTNKVGWPGERDVYRVDFQVPQGIAAGIAKVRLVAAWIPGSEVLIPTQ